MSSTNCSVTRGGWVEIHICPEGLRSQEASPQIRVAQQGHRIHKVAWWEVLQEGFPIVNSGCIDSPVPGAHSFWEFMIRLRTHVFSKWGGGMNSEHPWHLGLARKGCNTSLLCYFELDTLCITAWCAIVVEDTTFAATQLALIHGVRSGHLIKLVPSNGLISSQYLTHVDWAQNLKPEWCDCDVVVCSKTESSKLTP